MPRGRVGLVAAASMVAVALTACGSGHPSTEALDPGSHAGPGNGLRVTDSHGYTFTLHPDHVTCAPSEDGHGVQVVHLMYTEMSPLRGVDIDVVPVERPTTYSLPVDRGDSTRGPRNAYVFVTARIPAPRAPHEPPAFENSTDEERASGRLTVLRASCHPARLELTIDGKLGSEYSDPNVTVTGGVDLTGS